MTTDTKISALPSVSSPQLSDYLVGDFGNSTYTGKVLISNLAALIGLSSIISGGTITNTSIGSSTISGSTMTGTPISGSTGSFTNLSYSGLLTGGTGINYSDTGILGGVGSNLNSYNQIILQNQNSGASASANYNVSNNIGTPTTNFGEFGMNSSNFSGSSSFSLPGAVYLAAATTDLVVGTYGSNAIHFVVNSNSTDAGSISASGAWTINGALTAASLNSTPIGATTPSSGAFTTLTAAGINSTPIGSTSPSTGVFTALSTASIAGMTTPLSVAQGGTASTTGPAALVALGERTGATGSVAMPSGTTAQRDASPQFGYFRTNTSTNQVEWYNGSTWTSVGGGATGAGGDAAFQENDELVTTSYSIGQGALISGVTITIASPGVLTLANHGYVAGQPVHLTTTGALPTGLSAGSQYFVLNPTTNTFNLALTVGGSAINTSGSQSGVHSVGKSKNAVMVGPLNVASGATLTIPSGSRLVVL